MKQRWVRVNRSVWIPACAGMTEEVLAFHFRGVLAILGYLVSSCFTFISGTGERGMV
jgi:hypothetical protein